ncbi:MAG: acyl-CoA dehydrogenase [Acidimicrobiales bacterium]|nr:MAG: acyl-CoA dehydrogenase [Acidimicrobiales bacterium]
MADYEPPLWDMEFALDATARINEIAGYPGFDAFDPEMVEPVLSEAGRFIQDTIAPLNRNSDTQGARWQEDNSVQTPDGFSDAYGAYVEAGWGAVPFDPAYGGGGFPWTLALAIQEMMNSACMSFALCPLLTQGAIDLLSHHGSEEQKETWLAKLVSGEWSATMNLTEPDAGSDVGALRSKAEPVGDGTYRISGQKIFITYGEHDMTDNIVHLVLARTPDAPPGTKGISTFIVPKFLLDDAGQPSVRNDVSCVSIEHKLGIHGSPTCVLSFGETEGAIGYLIGEENRGMAYMFTMMNNARLSVGTQGLAIAERAYQDAVDYARERKQGRALGAAAGTASPIVEHPDVRRMLMTMKAYIEAMRGLAYLDAAAVDGETHHPDEGSRSRAGERAALLTPITKGWCTDIGCEMTSLAIQVWGGMGFVEESGVAQHFRDARINPIYEGTNGIQALDLVARKLPLRGGAAIEELLDEVDATATAATGALPGCGTPLAEANEKMRSVTADLATQMSASPVEGFAGATPYLRMIGQVLGGWVLTAQALVAQERIDAGDTDPRLALKVQTAEFYCTQLLPLAAGYAPSVLASSGQLMDVGADQF